MKTATGRTTQSPEEVLSELRFLVKEAENIIGMAPKGACTCDDDMLADLQERLETAQARLSEAYDEAKRKVVKGAKRADDTIRENPYQSIAIALGAGLLAGALLGRRFGSSSQ